MAGLVEGKVAVVTGAGSGIGRATALLLAAEGAAGIVVSDLDGGTAAETADLVRDEWACDAGAMRVDVAHVEEVEEMVRSTVDRFGCLDVAVNNAAMRGPWGSIVELSDEDWHRVLDVNLSSVFFCMRAEIRAMLKVGEGAIVNVASSTVADPHPSVPSYVASKFGVVGLTRAVAGEFPEHIRINAVLPGATKTGMQAGRPNAGDASSESTPRMAHPHELAEAIVWLTSSRSSWMHGHGILVDGGGYAYKSEMTVGLPAGLEHLKV